MTDTANEQPNPDLPEPQPNPYPDDEAVPQDGENPPTGADGEGEGE